MDARWVLAVVLLAPAFAGCIEPLEATLEFGPRPQVPLVTVGNATAESW